MTAIAGIVENGKVWIGGDSAASGGSVIIRKGKDPKVFRNGEFLIGYSTSFRMGQILEHLFEPPNLTENITMMQHMVKYFIPAAQKVLVENGYSRDGGAFLVGFRGELFSIEPGWQITRPVTDYHSCGIGADIVRSSLFTSATVAPSMGPRDRIALALHAADYLLGDVARPFHILSTPE